MPINSSCLDLEMPSKKLGSVPDANTPISYLSSLTLQSLALHIAQSVGSKLRIQFSETKLESDGL